MLKNASWLWTFHQHHADHLAKAINGQDKISPEKSLPFSTILRLSALPVAVPPFHHPYDSSTNHYAAPYLMIF